MTRATNKHPEGVGAPGRASIAARTLRTDRWWQEPTLTAVGLTIWVLYAVVRTASQRWLLRGAVPLPVAVLLAVRVGVVPEASRDFGTWFGHFPPFVPLALLMLPFLLGLPADLLLLPQGLLPVVLAVAAGLRASPSRTRKYTGETRFPLIIQNVHRYFFYAAGRRLADQHLGRDPRVPRQGRRLRHRARHGHHRASTSCCSWTYTAVVPLVPAHHGRPAAALLRAPDALQGVDVRVQAQHPSTCSWPGRRWRR